MLFLIEYARDQGQIVSFQSFEDDNSTVAQNTRLELELDLNHRGVEHEVVVLEAENEQALRRTHRRYFEGIRELVNIS